jgi:hypothetical protein
MMSYKTFRWRIQANTPTDIDTVLNALPAGTFVEGYAEVARMELRGKT